MEQAVEKYPGAHDVIIPTNMWGIVESSASARAGRSVGLLGKSGPLWQLDKMMCGRQLSWSNEFDQEASPDVLIYGDRIGKLGRLVPACDAVIFDSTGKKVLLTRRSDNGRWCLPGGAMDPGESASECCVRDSRSAAIIGSIRKET